MGSRFVSIKLKFEPRGLWVGVYWNFDYLNDLLVYLCFVPCFPLIIKIPQSNLNPRTVNVRNTHRFCWLIAALCGVSRVHTMYFYPSRRCEFDFNNPEAAEHFAFILEAWGQKTSGVYETPPF